MVGAAAGIGGKRLHARPVELGRDRRGQFIGDQHRRPIHLAEQLLGSLGAVTEVEPQPSGDVGDIGLALAEVGVLHRHEDVVQLFVGTVHGPRGVHALGADDGLRASHQHGVVEHQQLRVEERGQLATRAMLDARLDVLQLLLRGRLRAQQRRHFLIDPFGRDRKAHDLGALGQHDRAAEDDAG